MGEEGWNCLLEGGSRRRVAVVTLDEAAWREGQHPCVQGQQLQRHVEGEGSGQRMAARSARCVTRVAHHASLLRDSRGGATTEATAAVLAMGFLETVLHHVTGQHGHAQLSAASLDPCASCQTSFSFSLFQVGMVAVALCWAGHCC